MLQTAYTCSYKMATTAVMVATEGINTAQAIPSPESGIPKTCHQQFASEPDVDGVTLVNYFQKVIAGNPQLLVRFLFTPQMCWK